MSSDVPISPGEVNLTGRLRGRWTAWDVAFAIVLVVAIAAFLYIGRTLTVWWDEWQIIDEREAWTLDALLRPHNGHWSFGLMVVYKTLLAIFGMQTYLPYLLVPVLLHAASATAAYVIARRIGAPVVAFAAATVLLAFGAGWEGFLWGFQIGFAGGIAAGAWALVVLLHDGEPRHRWTVVVLLVLAVSTSGTGLPYLGAAIIASLLSPYRRRLFPLVLPAIALYLLWSLAYRGSTFGPEVLQPANLLDAMRSTWTGIAWSISSISGLGLEIAAILAVLLATFIVAHVLGPGPLHRPLLTGVSGLVMAWGLISLTRTDDLVSSRYLYLGAFFAVLVAVSVLALLHRTGSRARVAAVALGIAGVALTTSTVTLNDSLDEIVSHDDRARATVDLLLRYGGTPGVPDVKGPDDEYYPPQVPGPARLRELVARYGSPVHDPYVGPPYPIPTWALDTMLVQIIKPRIVETLPATLPAVSSSVNVLESVDVSVDTRADGCLEVGPGGEHPTVVVQVPRHELLYLESPRDRGVALTISRFGEFHPLNTRVVPLQPRVPWSLQLPDLGEDAAWIVRLEPEGASPLVVCTGPDSTG